MKSMAMKILREEFGIRKVQGKHLGAYSFYTLCGFIKAARKGEEVK